MRLGIFAKTFAGTDPMSVLSAAREAGFAAVQYNMACSGLDAMPDHISPDTITTIRQATVATGIEIAAVSGTYNMIHPDRAVRQAGQRRLKLLIENATAMGTPMVTLCTGTRDPDDQWCDHPANASPEAWADLLAEMAQAAMVAEAHTIRLGIEPELANVVSDAGKARLLIDTLQSPALAVVLDPANLFERTTLAGQHRIFNQAVELLGDRIVMAHAKDRDSAGHFVAAGQGVIDFPYFLSLLNGAGFQGDLVTHGLSADAAPSVARFLTRALAPR